MSATGPALDVRALEVRYGGVRAVIDLSLAVQPGEIVGLIGPNGAGKTSAIDGISGYTPIARGSVHLGGRDITHVAVHKRARAGLGRTFQQLELFDDLTVHDNLLLAARATGRGDEAGVAACLDRFGLTDRADATIAELPQGVRRLTAIARSCASEPRVLMLDEPAAGLDNRESDVIHDRLRSLAADGTAILLVEHDMALVMKTCDRLLVLEFGQTIGAGTPAEVQRDQRILEAYLGIEKEVLGA